MGKEAAQHAAGGHDDEELAGAHGVSVSFWGSGQVSIGVLCEKHVRPADSDENVPRRFDPLDLWEEQLGLEVRRRLDCEELDDGLLPVDRLLEQAARLAGREQRIPVGGFCHPLGGRLDPGRSIGLHLGLKGDKAGLDVLSKRFAFRHRRSHLGFQKAGRLEDEIVREFVHELECLLERRRVLEQKVPHRRVAQNLAHDPFLLGGRDIGGLSLKFRLVLRSTAFCFGCCFDVVLVGPVGCAVRLRLHVRAADGIHRRLCKRTKVVRRLGQEVADGGGVFLDGIHHQLRHERVLRLGTQVALGRENARGSLEGGKVLGREERLPGRLAERRLHARGHVVESRHQGLGGELIRGQGFGVLLRQPHGRPVLRGVGGGGLDLHSLDPESLHPPDVDVDRHPEDGFRRPLSVGLDAGGLRVHDAAHAPRAAEGEVVVGADGVKPVFSESVVRHHATALFGSP